MSKYVKVPVEWRLMPCGDVDEYRFYMGGEWKTTVLKKNSGRWACDWLKIVKDEPEAAMEAVERHYGVVTEEEG